MIATKEKLNFLNTLRGHIIADRIMAEAENNELMIKYHQERLEIVEQILEDYIIK